MPMDSPFTFFTSSSHLLVLDHANMNIYNFSSQLTPILASQVPLSSFFSNYRAAEQNVSLFLHMTKDFGAVSLGTEIIFFEIPSEKPERDPFMTTLTWIYYPM